MRGRAVALAAAVVALLASAPSLADTPAPPAGSGGRGGLPSSSADEHRDPYSPYERQTIDEAVDKLHVEIEPHPEGKVLEGVDVVTLDVFEKRDPLPGPLMRFANWFHATTRHYVIEREVLVSPGHRWDQALVDETARNLRGLPQLSLVLCVPLRGSAPGKVRLLVITKDVWSLRLNSNYTFENGRLEYLFLQPSEENLVGSHQQIYGNFVLDPGTITLGGQYVLPRLDGSRIALSVAANAVLNRATGHAEGSTGSFAYGQPLYSTLAKWAWGASIAWDDQIQRYYIGGQFTDFNPATGQCVPIANGAMPDGPKGCRYESDNLSGSYAVTRSWGSSLKHDLSFGFSASRAVNTPFDLSAFTPADQKAFAAAILPLTDTQIGPFVEYHDYSSRFIDVLDFETLGLTENFRRGHEVFVHVAPITTALHSTRNFVDIVASAAYTVPLGDGLVRGIVQSNVEVSTDSTPPAAQGRIPDGSIEGGLRIETPRIGIGRLVLDAHLLDRYHDYLNLKTTIGGSDRLRGYPSASFIGNDFLAANLEFRSRAVEIWGVHIGGAAFFDSGDAFNDFTQMSLKHSIGVGVRVLFPQIQRTVMRFDWGFPLTQGPGLPAPFPGDVTITFGQAFDVPTIPTSAASLPSYLGTSRTGP
jgi:hypothetical protein